MKTFRIISILSIFLMIVSCDIDDESSDETGVEVQIEKWVASNIKNYDYTLQITCFCIREYTLPKRIEVRGNNIVSVEDKPFENEDNSPYRTIDGFFEYILEQQQLNPAEEKIEYDTEFGFPSYIFFDISEMIADDEILFTLSDFTSY